MSEEILLIYDIENKTAKIYFNQNNINKTFIIEFENIDINKVIPTCIQIDSISNSEIFNNFVEDLKKKFIKELKEVNKIDLIELALNTLFNNIKNKKSIIITYQSVQNKPQPHFIA